jgi:hypothetical protein
MVDHVDWVTALRQFVDPFEEVRLKVAKPFECARTAPRDRAKRDRLPRYHASKRQCCDAVAVVKKPLNPSNGVDVSSHYLFGVLIR